MQRIYKLYKNKKVKKNILIVLIAFLSFSCSNPKDEWKMVWSDDFDYNGLPDSTKWSFDTKGNDVSWGNYEAQFYTDKDSTNAYVSDGVLRITARLDSSGGKRYTSARLITKGKGDWLYGKFDIRAKLPSGVGSWPAIWMLPTDWEYGEWPNSGEIDIMENVGYNTDTVLATAHTKIYNHILGTQVSGKIFVSQPYEDFHIYTLEWDQNEWRAYVDKVHFYTHKNDGTGFGTWPYDKRFHLIINLAIGGSLGGKYGVDDLSFPKVMEVDYVKVYQKI